MKGDVIWILIWFLELYIVCLFKVFLLLQIVEWIFIKFSFDLVFIDVFFVKCFIYQIIDFVDIGDDYIDLFLMKMVYQGFIEKGVFGYYNIDGEVIGSGYYY